MIRVSFYDPTVTADLLDDLRECVPLTIGGKGQNLGRVVGAELDSEGRVILTAEIEDEEAFRELVDAATWTSRGESPYGV